MRSSAILICYLLMIGNISYADAKEKAKKEDPQIDPRVSMGSIPINLAREPSIQDCDKIEKKQEEHKTDKSKNQ